MRQLLYILGIVGVFVTSCKKDTSGLDPENGSNTFGCRVNGVTWSLTKESTTSEGITGGFTGSSPSASSKWNVFLRGTKGDEAIHLWINNVVKPGEYQLNFDTSVPPFAMSPKNYAMFESSDFQYMTTSKITGKVNITKADTVAGIVSGTFSFKAVGRTDASRTIEVTEGRFDLKP